MKALHSDIPDINKRPINANTGLWYDKYCNKWTILSPEEKDKIPYWSLGTAKSDWIKTVTGLVGDQEQLNQANDRLSELAQTLKVEPILLKTQWRFVTGLGRQHPVENGFAWHQTLGTPYLPGSSVKGMVRAWAAYWEEVDLTTIDRIFGPKGKGEVGSVIFLDALPTSPVLLEEDVMTPHYVAYYSDAEAPGDWNKPVPIPFLTVAENEIFQFIVAPRTHSDPPALIDARAARTWLEEALRWIGGGAKTAVGYGRMDRDLYAEKERERRIQQEVEEKRQHEEKQRIAALTPEMRQVDNLRKAFEKPGTLQMDNTRNAFFENREKLLRQALKWSDSEARKAASELLYKIYEATNWGNEIRKRERLEKLAKLRDG